MNNPTTPVCSTCGKEKCDHIVGDTCHFTKCHGHLSDKPPVQPKEEARGDEKHECYFGENGNAPCLAAFQPDTPKEEAKAPVVCCEGGYFGETHDCCKEEARGGSVTMTAKEAKAGYYDGPNPKKEDMTLCQYDGNELPCEHPAWELEYHKLMSECLYDWDMLGAHGFDDPIVTFISRLLAEARREQWEANLGSIKKLEQEMLDAAGIKVLPEGSESPYVKYLRQVEPKV